MSISDFKIINTCFNANFTDICYFAFFDLLIGATFLGFNLLALIQMSKFYQKIKFENMLIIISIVQLIMFLIGIILAIKILIYLYIFMQIGVICLINYKFIKISKGFVKLQFAWINKAILIINALYLLALIVLDAMNLDNNNYIFCCYYLIELIAIIDLTTYCCKYLNLIKKLHHEKQKTVNNSSNATEKNSTREKKERDNIISIHVNSDKGNQLFYAIKKKQITLLYLANILCTIFGSSCQICLIVLESSEINEILIHLFYLISLFHNIIIFLCFFWIIRRQYQKSLNLSDIYSNDADEEGIINDKFIEEEVINIEKQNKIKEEDDAKNKNEERNKSYFVEDFEE